MNSHFETKIDLKDPIGLYTTDNSLICTESFDEEKGRARSCLNHLKVVTKVIKKKPHTKRRYVNISNELRLKLVDAVDKHGESILCAAKRLKINYSAAKTVCRVYKKEGRTKKKPSRVAGLRKKRTRINQSSDRLAPSDDIVKKEEQNTDEEQWVKLTQNSLAVYEDQHKFENVQTKDFSQCQSLDPRTFQKLEQACHDHKIFQNHSIEDISSLESRPSRNIPEYPWNLIANPLTNSLPPIQIQCRQTQMNNKLGLTTPNYAFGDPRIQLINCNLYNLKTIPAQSLPFYEDRIQLNPSLKNLPLNKNYQATQVFPMNSNPYLSPVYLQNPNKMAAQINREPALVYFVLVAPVQFPNVSGNFGKIIM